LARNRRAVERSAGDTTRPGPSAIVQRVGVEVVQRQLSDAEREELIQWARELWGKPLARFHTELIDEEAARATSLEGAKKKLRVVFTPSRTGKTSAELLKEAAEAADRFQKAQASSEHPQVAPGHALTTAETTKILHTGAASSCIAVAAFGAGTAFLAHWTNSDLDQPAARILQLREAVSEGASVWLAGELLDSEYGKRFQVKLTEAQFDIRQLFPGRTLAIRGDGAVSSDVKSLQ
jgi:hypothetical protein